VFAERKLLQSVRIIKNESQVHWTESIKRMVWRSNHNHSFKQHSQESEISPTCRRCGQSNETDWHWNVEEIVTREADPALTTVIEKVFHEFVHRFLNDWDKLKSINCSLIWNFRWKREWMPFELPVLGSHRSNWPSLQEISARTYTMWNTWENLITFSIISQHFSGICGWKSKLKLADAAWRSSRLRKTDEKLSS